MTDQTATGPFTLEAKLRARMPDNAHIFTGSAPPIGARPSFAETMLPTGASMVTAEGEHRKLPVRVCVEWTTPVGLWEVYAEETPGEPGRHNVRLNGPTGDVRLDGITASHLIALLELAGFIEPDMMADLVGPPA